MKTEKPFWENGVNPITGYRMTNFPYKQTKEQIEKSKKRRAKWEMKFKN